MLRRCVQSVLAVAMMSASAAAAAQATEVAAAQPVKSCWNLGPFHSADGARIVGAEAALRTARRASSPGHYADGKPNIHLTETGDFACHTPVGMTWPNPFVYKGLGHSGTLCPMTKLTPNFS